MQSGNEFKQEIAQTLESSDYQNMLRETAKRRQKPQSSVVPQENSLEAEAPVESEQDEEERRRPPRRQASPVQLIGPDNDGFDREADPEEDLLIQQALHQEAIERKEYKSQQDLSGNSSAVEKNSALPVEVKSRPIFARTPNETIDLICQLAKAKDKKGLFNLIQSGVCIDISNGKETAAMRIASEKIVDIEALELLIDAGAWLEDAAFGAAQGGHSQLVDNLIARGAELKVAIRGATKGSHDKLRDSLIAQTDKANLDQSLMYAAMGAVQAGDTEQLKKLCDRAKWPVDKKMDFLVLYAELGQHPELADLYIGQPSSLDDAVVAAALIGDDKRVNQLLARGAYVNAAVSAAAWAGNVDLMNSLLLQPGAHVHAAVHGAALGGHIELVDHLLRRGASLLNAVTAAAQAPHLALLHHLTSNEDLKSVRSLTPQEYPSLCGSIKREIHYRDKGLNVCLLDCIIVGAGRHLISGSDEVALRYLRSIQDSNMRDLIAKRMQEVRREFGKAKLDTSKLQKQVALCQTAHLSLDQALAWQKPEVQGILVMCQLGRYLPPQLYFIIAAYLSPHGSEKAATDLFNKIPILEKRKVNFLMDWRRKKLGNQLEAPSLVLTFFNKIMVSPWLEGDEDRVNAAKTDEELRQIMKKLK